MHFKQYFVDDNSRILYLKPILEDSLMTPNVGKIRLSTDNALSRRLFGITKIRVCEINLEKTTLLCHKLYFVNRCPFSI